MTGFFLRLTLWQLRGRVRRTLRLARKPKYAVGLVFGILYFGWLFLRPLLMGDVRIASEGISSIPDSMMEGMHVFFAMVIALYVAVSWLVMPGKDSLKLRAAELHLLLPAPVSRKQVNLYTLLRRVPSLLLTGLIIGFVASNGSGVDRLANGFYLVLLFTLWELHGKGRNLWKARLALLSPAQATIRRAVVVVLAGSFLVFAATEVYDIVRTFWAAIGASQGGEEGIRAAFAAVGDRAATTSLRPVLTPFLWITGGRLAEDPLEALRGWAFCVGLILILGMWVVNQRVRFDESALEEEQGDSRGRKRRRYDRMSEKARRRVPFRLTPRSRPELALLWKDLLVLGRYPIRLLLLFGLAGCAVVGAGLVAFGTPRTAVSMLAGLGGIASLWIAFLTGIIWPNAFHRDLRHLETLRTWPVPGRRLLLGASLSGTFQALLVILAGAALLLTVDVACRVAFSVGQGDLAGIVPNEGPFSGTPVGAILPLLVLGALPVLTGVAFVSSTLESLTAMLFPGWLLMAERQKGDPAAVGQKLLYGFGFFFAMAIGLLPGLVTVGLVLGLQHLLDLPLTGWELPALGLVAAAPLVLEGLLLSWFAGKLWERLDASEEILEGFA